MTQRRWVLLCGALFAAAWVHRALACGWEPVHSVRFGPIHAHSPMRLDDLDALDVEPGCFLDAGLVQRAYGLEASGRFDDALALYRGVERDAAQALTYRRGSRFLLHPLDVARTRLRVAGAPADARGPYLAAMRDYEEGHEDAARKALRDGGPLAEEWSCLEGLLALPRDAVIAQACFLRAGGSVRARWLLARAQRVAFERSGDRASLDRALATLGALAARADLGPLDDDVLCEIGRCHLLAGDAEAAARDYERVLANFPHGDMRDEAEESLLYDVYPALAKSGKASLIPPGVSDYWDGLRYGSVSSRYERRYTDANRPSFIAAMERGPEWLKPNAAYRVAACELQNGRGPSGAELLEWMLLLEPEGLFAPLAHFLLAHREAQGVYWEQWKNHLWWSQEWLLNGEAAQHSWDHLTAIAQRFPASEWAPAALSSLVIVAEKLGREKEAMAAAGRILRMQPSTGMPPHLRWAARHLRDWVTQGKVKLADIEQAGILDRYLLESDQPLELLARCPDSPFALRALVRALRETELDGDRSTNFPRTEDGCGWISGPEVVSANQGEARAAAERARAARPTLLAGARNVLARSAGANPRLLGFARMELARARLLAGDLDGSRADILAALGIAHEAAWTLWARETLARIDIRLGRFDDARRDIADLADSKPRERIVQALRGELGVALEAHGDRIGAIHAYLDMEPDSWDAWYLARVECRTDELRTLQREQPPNTPYAYFLWRRLISETRFAEARALAIDRKTTFMDPYAFEHLERVWMNVERSRRPSDPALTQEAERLVVDLGADDVGTRESGQERLLEIGPAATEAIRVGATSTDPERAARCRILLEEGPFDAAQALYGWATEWYRQGARERDDMRSLWEVIGRMSCEERETLERYLEREEPLIHARAIYRQVAHDFPDSAVAPKALYMVGLSSFLISQIPGECLSLDPIATAREAFLELARKYPSSSLADDALYWAGEYTQDAAEQHAIFERLVHDYPDSDVVRTVFPDGTSTPSEAGADAFRHQNEALRAQRLREGK